jgi:hypothetical protein
VHVRQLAHELTFGSIDARIDAGRIIVSTQGIAAFALDRPGDGPLTVDVDGQSLTFGDKAAIEIVRRGAVWIAGSPETPPLHKRAGLSGPIRDVFHEPLVFVYGTQDPDLWRANREVARAWARIRWGVDARYPVVADTELDESTAATHSLVLVGGAASNRITRELEPALPFRIDRGRVLAAGREYRGTNLGVVFVYPNPLMPARYVLVIEGADAFGTIRSLALPELLPDFIVYDERIATARGQSVLGWARPLAAGMFERDWSLVLP